MSRSLNSNFSDVVETASHARIVVSRPPALNHRPFEGHGLVRNWFWHLSQRLDALRAA